MKTELKNCRIVLVEDNPFEINLLEKNIKNYISENKLDKKLNFIVESYVTYSDFLKNINPDTSLVFSDYHLDKHKTAIDVLHQIKEKCRHCKVIILSNSQNEWKLFLSLLEGASGIIFKNEFEYSLCNHAISDQIKA